MPYAATFELHRLTPRWLPEITSVRCILLELSTAGRLILPLQLPLARLLPIMSILTQALSHAVVCSMLLGGLVKTKAIECVTVAISPSGELCSIV